jgi:nitrate reductase gamma subunit
MGVFLIALAYFAFIFLILISLVRVVKIVSMPAHLRWELAPIPHEKGKNRYGGSYLEDYEWWHKKPRKSLAAVLIYMAKEIILLKGVWKNNRALWPFSFSMHTGIYLVILSVLLHVINALCIITSVPAAILNAFENIAAIIAIVGYILGVFGVTGLILKRSLDASLRNFGTFSIYFRLVFLAAVFISGISAWFYTTDFAATIGLFTRNVLTLDTAITTSIPLAVNIIISLLFLIYLPLTDMSHFITKYFTYHAVRWNDKPLDTKMEAELNGLKKQTTNWSASHVPPDKTWAEIALGKKRDEKTP